MLAWNQARWRPPTPLAACEALETPQYLEVSIMSLRRLRLLYLSRSPAHKVMPRRAASTGIFCSCSSPLLSPVPLSLPPMLGDSTFTSSFWCLSSSPCLPPIVYCADGNRARRSPHSSIPKGAKSPTVTAVVIHREVKTRANVRHKPTEKRKPVLATRIHSYARRSGIQ